MTRPSLPRSLGLLILCAAPLLGGPARAEPDDTPFGLPALADGDLADTRAAAGDLAALTRQSSSVTGNRVGDNASSGAVRFDGEAFRNFNGFAVVIANSGANSSFNSSMSVNVSISAGPLE